jgi:hypothetical protein
VEIDIGGVERAVTVGIQASEVLPKYLQVAFKRRAPGHVLEKIIVRRDRRRGLRCTLVHRE